jgi:hypothetical protein
MRKILLGISLNFSGNPGNNNAQDKERDYSQNISPSSFAKTANKSNYCSGGNHPSYESDQPFNRSSHNSLTFLTRTVSIYLLEIHQCLTPIPHSHVSKRSKINSAMMTPPQKPKKANVKLPVIRRISSMIHAASMRVHVTKSSIEVNK